MIIELKDLNIIDIYDLLKIGDIIKFHQKNIIDLIFYRILKEKEFYSYNNSIKTYLFECSTQQNLVWYILPENQRYMSIIR